MKIARIYLRVSTDEQDLTRQARLKDEAIAAGFHIAGVYAEKASGARADRPELLRMISELQPGDVIVAENMDRITRLPLDEAEALMAKIRAAGARLSVPGLVDLSDVVAASSGVAKVVLEALQDMLLKILLQVARENYETMRERQRQGIERAKSSGEYKGRKPNKGLHARVIEFRQAKHTIHTTAKLAGCSPTLVKTVWADFQRRQTNAETV